MLINCDALRIIGCSLSPNDVHLIDLLFKAHLERREAFDIEVIDFEETGESIRDNYGFFPQIRTLSKIENILIPDTRTTNPAYLFAEELHDQRKASDLKEFANFFVKFLDEVKRNLTLLAKYENPENRVVLEQFQKYISQASVEPYAIRRRHAFLKKAFDYYRSPGGKGKIIRDA